MSDDNATEVLYVGGIDETIDEKSLYDIFSSFGDVRNIEVPINFVTKKNRGFAFVEYVEKDDAKHALYNMNNFELNGKRIYVNYSRNKKMEQYKPVWIDDLYNQEKMKQMEEGNSNQVENVEKDPPDE
ncbi:RNA-binding protein, putative [Plasmodium knowlesi strain H]|uniref:RNA-binding protein, putative n=4 Tax=Plasmodium TaxID=5820 RepID=A0A5K1V0D3_PLAKH|nr:RNA-binding protein, putative [Plasmodium knowlesi strain H]XP_019916545.1 Cyclophilin [Plasmodium coatneyi]OTN63807.1 putative Cyclophilin [Plasmodium knowlesi]ANQ09850.1 Cyclophilin [Plasmodium coatneyi]CAA9990815.1 RNA-binding protein, putative [Plasmodium knowlesi strain H]SBO21012.1 RNA-binding protein, putative [Plasmodium knowlesi strain H]SBO21508.1 RNA-binding protein, putative [Plasmodium knowlesi strain H]|eukprot:XP_002262103.1 cyclophilin, putative [Plasmodium knowlesi strain H]